MTVQAARRAVLAAVVPGFVVLSGCGGGSGTAVPEAAVGTTRRRASPSAARPTTPADVLERSQEAMAAGNGWTFAVRGEESLTMPGRTSRATYRATVHRTNRPEALRSTGTVVSKGASRREDIVVLDGTGHVREGGPGATWTSGPVSDPDIARKVEDPVAALDTFRTYVRDGAQVRLRQTGDEMTLRVRLSSGALSDRRDQPALEKAAREFRPTLDQLRAAGITASEEQIALRDFDEVLILDAATFRLRSHRLAFGFLVPYQGRRIAYSQEVREESRGAFGGTVELPADLR